MFYYLLDLRELADVQTHVYNARLALYFEINSRLNFAKIVLGYAKPVLRSPFLPTSLVHFSRKVSEIETKQMTIVGASKTKPDATSF